MSNRPPFRFSLESVGKSVPTTRNYNFHENFTATIASAVWYETDNYYGLRLNFTAGVGGQIESVNIAYAFKDENGYKESNNATILHNLVPILGLTDDIGNAGMQSQKGLVTDTLYNEKTYQYEAVQTTADHEPNMIGKEIGLILYQHYYINKNSNSIKSAPRIYEVYSVTTKQTGEDIANGEMGSDDKLATLCTEALTYSKNMLNKLQGQLSKSTNNTANESTREAGQMIDANLNRQHSIDSFESSYTSEQALSPQPQQSPQQSSSPQPHQAQHNHANHAQAYPKGHQAQQGQPQPQQGYQGKHNPYYEQYLQSTNTSFLETESSDFHSEFNQ